MEIILTRDELYFVNKSDSIDDINLYSFETFVSTYLLDRCDKVTFRDDDGTIKILKDRHN
jgi:hypothetical protein